MKTTNEIIAYLEGRQTELESRDPKPREAYFIDELLEYIKSDKPTLVSTQTEMQTPAFPNLPNIPLSPTEEARIMQLLHRKIESNIPNNEQ